jgi:hypothetical protein
MNEDIEKSDELIELEDGVIELVNEENPDEETVTGLLEDIYILGYEEAIKDMAEESPPEEQ